MLIAFGSVKHGEAQATSDARLELVYWDSPQFLEIANLELVVGCVVLVHSTMEILDLSLIHI